MALPNRTGPASGSKIVYEDERDQNVHLLPRNKEIEKPHIETSKKDLDRTSTCPNPGPSSTAATAAHLEILSTNIMEAHGHICQPSSRALLHQHCSPDFEMAFTNPHEGPLPYASSLESHISNIFAFKREHPDMCIIVENSTATVQGEFATVWLTIRGCSIRKKGKAGVVDAANEQLYNRESIAILYWRRRESDGEWICYRHEGIRGGGDMFP